jgi:RNA polymerase sigma-70 factor, ECF subfamily
MSVLELQPIMNAARRLPSVSGNPGIKDEQLLVAKAKLGHVDAFGELYSRHQRKAYSTALRIVRNQQDAEDAVQRAFQRALVNLQRFREDSAFSTWLSRIVINEALMLLRERRTRERRTLEPHYENDMDAERGNIAMEVADSGPTPEEILCEGERRAAVLEAVGRLRKSLKIIVLNRELKGLTSVETARLLGLSVGAVKARTFQARRFLRKNLKRKFRNGELDMA